LLIAGPDSFPSLARAVTVADGNVDLTGLTAKAKKHSAKLVAPMVTYPSAHGVLEEETRAIGEVIYRHGGQVYRL
jgi:glycine dehydrogenase